SGTSGRVYLVRHAEYGVIAAKVIKADKFDQREWDAAGAISNPGFQCPFVLKYHVATMAGDRIVILMEYANAKSLADIARNPRLNLSRHSLRAIIKQLLEGLRMVHT
ncbi:MAG: hypothetical protein EZS28_054580, partial [Streblomastix strix]